MQARASEQRGTHSVEGVGDGVQARYELQPVRKDADGKEHAAGDAGNAQKKPFCGIATLEKQQIAGRENSKTGKSEQSGDEHSRDGKPVRIAQRKTEKHSAPGEIDRNAHRCGGKRIDRRTGKNDGKRGLRNQKMFQRASVAGFREAAVESVHRGIQIVKKHEADQGKSKITSALRERLLELRAIHEARNVKKHSNPEEGLDGFQNEDGAVGARNGEVAPKESPDLAQGTVHCDASSALRCGVRPVSRKKASSRVVEPVLSLSAASVSQARRCPASITAMRSARISTSGKVCEAKSREVSPPRSTSDLRKRRNSEAAMASKLRVGSSNKR